MLAFLSGSTLISRIFVWMALAALAIGFAGTLQENFSRHDMSAIPSGLAAKIVADSFVQNFRIFIPRLDGIAGGDNWLVTLARLLGALVSFAATFAVLLRVFRRDFRRSRLAFIKDHTLIVGWDRAAQAFAKAQARATGTGVVIVDPASQARFEAEALSCGHHYLPGRIGGLAKALNAGRAAKARHVVISTGDDETNLRALHEISRLAHNNPNASFKLTLCLENARLLETLEREEGFFQIAGKRIVIRLFNRHRQSAISLLRKRPLVDLALAGGHERVRLVVVGDCDAAVETVLQFLRISPAAGLEKPRIDWIVNDTGSLIERLHTRNEPLYELVKSVTMGGARAGMPLAWAVDVALHRPASGGLLPDDELILELENTGRGRITAIVVAGRPESENTSLALVLRSRLAKAGAWRAPAYVLSPERDALEFLMRRDPADADQLETIGATSPQDVVEPFGGYDEVCGADMLVDGQDALAMRVHETYLSLRGKDGRAPDDPAGDYAARPWSDLPETYKIASRRSAHHIPVKLLSAGVSADFGPEAARDLADRLDADPGLMEALARIEHDAWRLERELDGWRYGASRDNARKLHPDLVPYEELSERIKEYDRVQIRLLAGG